MRSHRPSAAQFCGQECLAGAGQRDKNRTIPVLKLPFLGVETLEQERALSMALYDHPAVKDDLARWNATLLMPTPMPQYNLVGLGDEPRSLEGFDGMSVRATGGIGEAMEAVGAVPTSMSATEVRQAMDSGVVKAVGFAPHAHMAFGTIENGQWWTENLNPGTVNCPVVANTDALDMLSDDHREALLGSIDEALDYYIDNYENNTLEAWGPALEARSLEVIRFDEESIQNFEASVAGSAAEAWVENMGDRGIPAQELYDFATGTLADLKSGSRSKRQRPVAYDMRRVISFTTTGRRPGCPGRPQSCRMTVC
ncbi:MAG: C4-dicarboxylate ABC transporter substrate-binding protein [Pseudomonadota bacterium]